MTVRSVLVCGAGIAGTTLAFWLARNGFRPTVVERSGAVRSSGSPVDVLGAASRITGRMGIMPRLRAADTRVTDLLFVNAAGKRVGKSVTRATIGGQHLELPRGDLARILNQAARDDAEFLFDDTITALAQDPHGVDVTFQHTPPRRFDLVVGADGLHSAVRRLVFGPESGFVHHLGLYVATTPFTGPIDDPHAVLMYNAPGRAVAIHPSPAQPVAAFMFRHRQIPDFRPQDTGQHRALLAGAYAGMRWRVPEILRDAGTAPDLYFDSVSQVRMPAWSRGRVALLGDAAACVSLFGDGSSLAIIAAHTLAQELAAHRADPATALHDYESAHRPLVAAKQRNIGIATLWLIPATRAGILTRNLTTRLLPG